MKWTKIVSTSMDFTHKYSFQINQQKRFLNKTGSLMPLESLLSAIKKALMCH